MQKCAINIIFYLTYCVLDFDQTNDSNRVKLFLINTSLKFDDIDVILPIPLSTPPPPSC